MPHLQAVVFDFDGVLADSEPVHLQVFQTLLADEGVELTDQEYFERYLGFDDLGVFRALARDKGLEVGDGRIQALLEKKTVIFQDLVRRSSVLFPGAEACLRACAARVPIAIASGALRHEIELILQGAGLDGLVPVIVAAGDTPESKPAPDPYTRAVDLLEARHGRPIDPGRTVAIEDSRWGLQSARTAGLKVVALTTSYEAGELGAVDLILSDISDVTVDVLDRVASGSADEGPSR
jgi:beta-phosphoglucomutase-like phosphatase (HAD superfamily)